MKTIPFKICGKANEDNIIYYNDYRITILKNNLIRIEKSSNKIFNDSPTQLALFRNFEKVDFIYEINNDILQVFLDKYTLYFNGDLTTSYIVYDGVKLYLNNDYNLGGTYGTVDGMDGDKILCAVGNRTIGFGVCSTNGVALIDDKDSYCFNDEFEFYKKNSNEMDAYIFFYPNKYKEAVKTLFELSGYPPKLPKYVFGNWWSRFYAYTQDEYLYLIDSFIKQDIPLTIATVDMDWHYSSDNNRNIFVDLEMDKEEFIKDAKSKTQKYYCKDWRDNDPWGMGWTGWTFNKKLFPDYKAFFKEIENKGLKITLNIHPAQGIHFYEELYEKCAKLLNVDPKSKESVPFDLTNKENRSVWFKEIFNKYENDGVDFWWIDWQQGENSMFPGLTPMWLCNHYFMLDGFKNKNRPLILSRFCDIGGHRYPLGFSGDTYQTFDSLKYLIKTTSQASNVGFTYWSHDVGGHMNGYKDGDLYLKFVQFAVFSPILRLHSSAWEMFSKEPNLFLKGNGNLIKYWLRFRHKMIPYIYSYSLKTSSAGVALLEPMFYQNSNDKKAYKYKDTQYYFANDLLVAPYSNKKDKNDLNAIEVYFPSTNYYDLKYGYKYRKNSIVNIIREQGDIPVFIKEGAFFILDSNNSGNNIENPKELDVITTFGKGKYTFIEDNDVDKEIKTTFKNEIINDSQGIITIKIKGCKSLYQSNRVYNFKLLNIFSLNEINILNASIDKVYLHSGNLEFTVKDIEFNKDVVITYTFKTASSLDIIKNQVSKRLSYIDDDNNKRQNLFNIINKSNDVRDVKDIVKLINESGLSKHNIKILKEMLNA